MSHMKIGHEFKLRWATVVEIKDLVFYLYIHVEKNYVLFCSIRKSVLHNITDLSMHHNAFNRN